MLDKPKRVRRGEELNTSQLLEYLAAHGLVSRTLRVEQFPSGYSNLTYLLQLEDRQVVLRRPPFGNQVKSAHDMGREYRVLSGLSQVYAPAPRPLLYCDDPAIIGDEFYVMERRSGVILRGPVPPAAIAESVDSVRSLSQSFVGNLVQLHALDYQQAGLADVGKPGGYVDRQVAGWTKRFEAARTQPTPQIDAMAEWLHQHKPSESRAALIHNDYKYDNLMLDPKDLTRIICVMDWEMATIGDPLMDLGTSLAYWVEASDAPAQHLRAFGPTMVEGNYTRHQLVDEYARQSGREVGDPLVYYCYGLFKLAGIVQQIYARFARGATQDPRFANLDQVVNALGEAGCEAIDTGRI